MKEFNILTPGDKIKKIRENFDIKQEDMAGGEITRNLISIVENNKANLTEHTAKVLTQNINRICKEKQLDFSVTEEYLMENTIIQAKRIADEYIKEINNLSLNETNSFKDKLYEINYFCKNYKLEEKKSELYIVIGRKFKLDKQYMNAFDYYLKAFESSINKDNTITSLINLGMCSIYLSKYEEAIDYFNLILDLDYSSIEIQYRAEYNLALCYKKLKNYDKSLEILNSMETKYKENLESSTSEYIDFNILVGNCLMESKSFNEAISIFKNLLENITTEIDELLVLTSLADIYGHIKDYKKLDRICKKILNKLEQKSIDNTYEADICLSLAKNLRLIEGDNNHTIVALLFKALKSFKFGKSSMCFDDIEQIFVILLNNFIDQNDEKNISYLKNELLGLIDKEVFPRKNYIILRFIKYYNSKDHKEDIDSLVDFIIPQID